MRIGVVCRIAAFIMLLGVALQPSRLLAEANEIRIAIQPGLTYLPFVLMEHGKLIEKQARDAGLGDVKVAWHKVSGGDVMNDGLISGNLDIAASGTPAFLVIWAKTRNSFDLRGVAAYNT